MLYLYFKVLASKKAIILHNPVNDKNALLWNEDIYVVINLSWMYSFIRFDRKNIKQSNVVH